MLGAIIGDMVGSIYEFHPLKKKDFNIYNPKMRMTDDSLLTIAVAKTLINHYPIKYDEESLKELQKDLVNNFVDTWSKQPHAGFGSLFYKYCQNAYLKGETKPYNSFGNGGAMRISPVGWLAHNEEEVKTLSKVVTEVTHNHPEGLKGAEAIAMCIYLALHGASKEKIKKRMINEYYPEISSLNFDDLVKNYKFSSRSQDSVPQAIYCFLISDSLEDTIRTGVAIGGDVDTICCMAASIAEAYYQKETLSPFEEQYLYLMIDPEVESLIKKFHKCIDSHKFDK